VVDLVAHQADLRFLLEKVSQAFIKVAMHGTNCSDGVHFTRLHQRPQVAALVGVVVLFELAHAPAHIFGIGAPAIVLQIELHLLDRPRQHELVLRLPDLAVGTEPLKLLVNADDLLEVKLLKVNVEPPHQEVDEVPLLQLVVPEAAESLQHLRKVPVEVVEGAHSPNALPVLSYSFHVSCCALELSLELLGAQAHRSSVGNS
jgi:hypothetical protein